MNAIEAEAMEWLKSPDLLDRLVSSLDGIIPGQEEQKKLMFMVLASSYLQGKTEKLHLMVNSESSAGKSFFMKKFAKLLPLEKKEYFTRITPSSLNYYKANEDDWTWDNKILFLEDVGDSVVNSDAVKVFISEGSRIITVRNQKAIELNINGTPIIVLTLCEPIPKQEVANRFILMDLDESKEQTARILNAIAEEFNSGGTKINPVVREVFRAMRIGKVRVNDGEKYSRLFPVEDVRARRDFKRFMTLVCTSAILHQNQREQHADGRYIAGPKDYEVALDVFSFISQGGDMGITHTQKKAIKELKAFFTVRRRKAEEEIQKGTIKTADTDLSMYSSPDTPRMLDDASRATIKEIASGIPSRAERNWRNILERLVLKGYVNLVYTLNQKTGRECAYFSIANRANKYTPFLEGVDGSVPPIKD